MLALFRNFGGRLKGHHTLNGQQFKFTPAINKAGDLYVSIFKGKSTRRYYALSLDEWADWAEEYIILEETANV